MNSSRQTKDLETVLRTLDAKLAAWQVRALFLGAHTSTNVRFGIQHLLGHIFGDPPVLGAGLEDANANLRVLTDTWNGLIADHQSGQVRFSVVQLSDPPLASELNAFLERRLDELNWNIKGIDAGGDDPIELGPEGQNILTRIAEGSALLQKYGQFLGEYNGAHADDALRTARETLEDVSETIERLVGELLVISAAVRKRAIDEHGAMRGRTTDDGASIARAVKIGSNALCLCGSGRKWKRCCGAPASVH